MKLWIFLIFILIMLILIIVFPKNQAHDLFLHYISTIISWPAVILILSLAIFLIFKGPISEILRRGPEIEAGKGFKIKFPLQPEVKEMVEKTKIKEIKEKLEKEKRTTKGLSTIIDFERIIRSMYRSQFQLLKSLKGKGPMPLKEMMRSYFAFLGLGGSKEYRSESYFMWLVKNELINFKIENGEYFTYLDNKGISFLNYCEILNYSEKEFIPL